MSSMLREGEAAPDFSLKDSNGKVHKLSDYRGKKIVLYFYPKDDTPGCTKQACDLRDNNDIRNKAVVIGISADSVESHKRFEEKYGLNFILLSDPERKAIKAYGALKEKSIFGNTFLGIRRSTFIINEKRVIVKVFPDVNASTHAKKVLDALT